MDDLKRIIELWGVVLRWKPERLSPAERSWLSDVVDGAPQPGSYDKLARFHEAWGTAELLWFQARPDVSSEMYLDAVGHLVKASHWFHLAGEHESARAVGSRALAELNRLFPQGESREDIKESLTREMMGDAAVWVDAQLASEHYQEAIRGFRVTERHEHEAALNEIFPGRYTAEMMKWFLGADAGCYVDGEKRVKYKMNRWLGKEF